MNSIIKPMLVSIIFLTVAAVSASENITTLTASSSAAKDTKKTATKRKATTQPVPTVSRQTTYYPRVRRSEHVREEQLCDKVQLEVAELENQFNTTRKAAKESSNSLAQRVKSTRISSFIHNANSEYQQKLIARIEAEKTKSDEYPQKIEVLYQQLRDKRIVSKALTARQPELQKETLAYATQQEQLKKNLLNTKTFSLANYQASQKATALRSLYQGLLKATKQEKKSSRRLHKTEAKIQGLNDAIAAQKLAGHDTSALKAERKQLRTYKKEKRTLLEGAQTSAEDLAAAIDLAREQQNLPFIEYYDDAHVLARAQREI